METENRDNGEEIDLDAPSTPTAAATLSVIERFGGLRPLAGKLDIPVTTVQGWKKRGAIPANRHAEIIAAAARHNIDLSDLERAFTSEFVAGGPAMDGVATPGSSEPLPYAGLTTPPLGRHGLNTLWLALATSLFIMIAVFLAFAGFYLVKQKASKLEQRVMVLERNTAIAPAVDARLAALEQQMRTAPANTNPAIAPERLQEIDHRLAELGTETAQVAVLSRQVSDLQATTGNHELLTQTLASLQSTVQGLSQSLDTLRDKVGQLSGEVADRRLESSHQFALLLAVSQLRQAAETSQPFDTELVTARGLAHGDPDFTPALTDLGSYAADGAPTLNELRQEFADLATEIVRSNVVGSGKSWFRQALYRLGSVITVRKIGSKSHDNTAEVLVSQAESKLEEDDLAGTVQILGGLTGLPKDVAAAWVEAAGRRLAVDAALAELSTTLVDRAESLGALPPATVPAP